MMFSPSILPNKIEPQELAKHLGVPGRGEQGRGEQDEGADRERELARRDQGFADDAGHGVSVALGEET